MVGKRRKKPDLPTGLPCGIRLAKGRELSGTLRGLRRARRHPILQAKNRSSGGDLGGPGNPWVAAGLIAGHAGRCGHWPSMARAGSVAASPPCSGMRPWQSSRICCSPIQRTGMSRPALLVRDRPKTRSASIQAKGMCQGARFRCVKSARCSFEASIIWTLAISPPRLKLSPFSEGRLSQVTRTPEGAVPRYFVRDDAGNSVETDSRFPPLSRRSRVIPEHHSLLRLRPAARVGVLRSPRARVAGLQHRERRRSDRLPARPDRYAPRPGRNLRLARIGCHRQRSIERWPQCRRFCDWAIIAGTLYPAEPDAGQQEYQQAFGHRSAPTVL